MDQIIYDARLIRTFETANKIGEDLQLSKEFIDQLWQGLIDDRDLMKEFIYYLENNAILDKYKICEYGLSDMLIWEMRQYDVFHDQGKNGQQCDKMEMVFHTFYDMILMKENPEKYIEKFEGGLGMDRFQ